MQGIEQLLAVLLVVALAAGMVLWLRRRGLAGPAANGVRKLELAGRLTLGPQHSLHLVRLGNREVLIGRSPAGLTLLVSRELGDAGEEAVQ